MTTKKLFAPATPQVPMEKNQQHRQRKQAYQVFQQSAAFKARRCLIIKRIALINIIMIAIIFPVSLLVKLIADSGGPAMLIITGGWGLLSLGIFYYVNPYSQVRLRNASYAMLLSGLTGAVWFQLMVGAATTVWLGYLWLAVLAALLGLSIREVIGVVIICVLVPSTLSIILNHQTPLGVFYVVSIVALIITGVVVLVQSLYQALGDFERSNQQYLESNQALSRTNQLGREVSTSLNSIVVELSATSRQQANGAQEQAAALVQVTSSLTELGETARQIANNASRVSQSAKNGLHTAGQVWEATQKASKTAEQGQAAVDSSITSIEEVRNGIGGLAERLMTLTERSHQTSSIIAIIKEIADQTHLLALNAAIESAGAGENGRRFSVVASEVKSLADRSLEATRQVSHVIGELQGAVAAAVLASEETRKKTFGAVERSYQAGRVIDELGKVVDATTLSSVQIVEAVQQVSTLAEEISFATQQQESASRQLIATMEAVGIVVRETAGTVTQVSETVNRIDNLSGQLKEVLTTPSPEPSLV